MKNLQCSCGRYVGANKTGSLELFLTNKTCDVYGCPSYISGLDPNWSDFTKPKRPYTRLKNQSRQSKKSFQKKHDSNPTVTKYFFDLLGKSSINGINNCTTSESIVAKFVWSVIFVLCLSGFVFQTYVFYSVYSSKPSIVQIEVEKYVEMEFPAVTVCTTNRFRKSVFCKYYPDKCMNISALTLSEYNITELMYNLLLNNETAKRNELGHSMSIIQACNFKGTPLLDMPECLKVWEKRFDPDFGNCFTFTSTNTQNEILQAREVDFWQEENDLNIVADVESEEFMEEDKSAGLVVTVHDLDNFPDIHTEGIDLHGGYSYVITVARTTVLLLPLPYKTNCTDYVELPWQKDSKRLTSRMCTVGCSQYHQLQNCGYITKSLSLFSDELPYVKADITDDNIACAETEENNTRHYCRTICGLPCKDEYFTTTVSASKLSEEELGHTFKKRSGKHTTIDNIVQMRIYYSTLEHKIYRHTPKYETMELFSYLGGYSGVWLGFSLLTAYEFIEIAWSTFLYSLRKLQRQRQHKRLIRSILSSKGSKNQVKLYRKTKRG